MYIKTNKLILTVFEEVMLTRFPQRRRFNLKKNCFKIITFVFISILRFEIY